jgi:hypothetical protein
MFNFRFRYLCPIFAVLLFASAMQAQVQVVNSQITTVAGNGSGCAGETDSVGDGCAATSS